VVPSYEFASVGEGGNKNWGIVISFPFFLDE
jgi:hypothetical protein